MKIIDSARCCECDKHSDFLIEIGEPHDYTTWLCLDCITKASNLLASAKLSAAD